MIPILLLGIGCSSESSGQKVAGGEDFPNTLSAYGDSIVVRLSESANWNLLNSGNANPTFGSTSIPFENSASGALAKTTADSTEIIYTPDFSDTAQSQGGLYRIFITQIDTHYTSNDTLVMLWDEFARDEISDNENFVSFKGYKEFSNGTYEYFHFSDADGDGIVRPQQGCAVLVELGCNYARLKTLKKLASGILLSNETVVGAGVDQNFDLEEDNSILSGSELLQNSLGDTLGFVHYTDADSDGFIVGSGDSSIVDVFKINTRFSRAGFPERIITEARLVVFPKDSLSDYPLRYRESELNSFGGSRISEFLTTAPDSNLRNGDTVVLSIIQDPPFNADLLHKTTEVQVILGDLKDEEAHRFLSMTTQVQNQNREGLRIFSMESSSPLKDGEDPESGTFYYQYTLKSEDIFVIDGAFSPDGIQAVVTNREGEVFNILYSNDGELIKVE
jgi:hypothetical protein